MRYKIKGSYISKLGLAETLFAKEEIRKAFKEKLKTRFNIQEVEPAIVTDETTWLNDDFNMSERPINFDTMIEAFGQVVQSNVKWRRKMLTDLDLKGNGVGILTDGLYLRRDRDLSNISAIAFNEIGFDVVHNGPVGNDVKEMLTDCYRDFITIDKEIGKTFPDIEGEHFDAELTLVTASQLKILYPLLSVAERLTTFGRNNGSFILYDFVNSILDSKNEAQYSQDVYDFESYCELYVYNKTLQQSVCIGWGAKQVDRNALKKQTEILREDWKGKTEYENAIKSDALLDTISISFDFARIVMTYLEKQHIGEIISSVWEQEFLTYAKSNHIKIL